MIIQIFLALFYKKNKIYMFFLQINVISDLYLKHFELHALLLI